MCVDYTSLNKACPKNSYPLPRIDQLVDSISSHEALSFLYAYNVSNQIPMRHDDMGKTTFITTHKTYYYKVMPFR